MDLARKLSFLVILVCVFIALNNQRAALRSPSVTSVLEEPSAVRRDLGGDEPSPHSDGGEEERRLAYDFYASSCPSAEQIVRTSVRELHGLNSSVGPALLRLAFHDCFVMACDASVLLDSDSDGGIESEKEKIPNLSLKGFREIDAIKSRLEQECPAVVSCADIVALAARESVLLAGGQFYPVLTGRLDSKKAFPEQALSDLPGPDFNITRAVDSFSAKGFNPREMVALIGGGHSTGKIHCNFILPRLYNFNGTNQPDPSLNAEFLEVLRSQCSSQPSSPPSAHPSPSPPSSFEDLAMKMDYEGSGNGFGEVYYRSVMQGKGLLVSDQQLMAREDTKSWVQEYASNLLQFRRDFGHAMFKLSHIQGSNERGEVRLHCRKVNR